MTKAELFKQVISNLQKVHNKTDLTPFDITEVILEAGFHITKEAIMQVLLSGDSKEELADSTIDFMKRVTTISDELGDKLNEIISRDETNIVDVGLVLVTMAHQLFSKINKRMEDGCDCDDCNNNCSTEESDNEEVSEAIAALLRKLSDMESDKNG